MLFESYSLNAANFKNGLTLISSENENAGGAASCKIEFNPDIPLENSNAEIEAQITGILERYLDLYLGKNAPSSSELTSANSKYSKLNITISNGTISGNIVSNYNDVSFLKTYANQLRHHPDDEIIKEKAKNTVWLVSDQLCKGTKGDLYKFRDFARPAAIMYNWFDDNLKDLFTNTLYEFETFEHFWVSIYDEDYQSVHESINTDIIYNLGDALMVFAANQSSPEERYRWMKGFTRWLERFCSHTSGTANGIKADATGFHHWTAYDNYMYAFKTAGDLIYYVAGTDFQINKENYLLFRDAIYAQIVFGNEAGEKALSMCGRKPHERGASYTKYSIERLAIAGGIILGLSTADPVLAGEYNRICGVFPDFNYDSETTLSRSSGYFQFNFANMGIFRKNDWLAVSKGFTNGLWGAEIYPTNNRYGRYQSYGTLEIIYPGSLFSGNGYNVKTWNWNYNPGATTIVLPWDKLHGERARIDESQKKSFAGALSFKNKKSETLTKTHGNIGLFAMDFQEMEDQGLSTRFGPNNHNGTFTFKKSTFAFEDIIVALGSDITNDDYSNQTVTTLFQRVDTKSNNLVVNNSTQSSSAEFSLESDNWVISNYNTGFYVVSGQGKLVLWNGEQQTPYHDQTDPSEYINNVKQNYWIGFIDHGKNPNNSSYEYIAIPEATATQMEQLSNAIKAGNKPYTVQQKNSTAHILEHNSGVWAYAIFEKNSTFENSGLIKEVSEPCLLMYEPGNNGSTLKLAISNPDMGILSRSFKPAVDKQIEVILKGDWSLENIPGNAQVSKNNGNTVLSFLTQNGLPIELDLKSGITSNFENLWVEEMSQIILYPNPNKGIFTIENNTSENGYWKIYNSVGIAIFEGEISPNKNLIDVNGILPGLYLVKVYVNNKHSFTEKIIIQSF